MQLLLNNGTANLYDETQLKQLDHRQPVDIFFACNGHKPNMRWLSLRAMVREELSLSVHPICMMYARMVCVSSMHACITSCPAESTDNADHKGRQ